MSSQSQHWTLFDNDPLSNPDYYHFTQQFSINNSQGFFAIATEHLPINNKDRSVASRTERGAELAIDAARLAFSEILDNELDFSEVFLRLFSKQWKAAVLLDAIKSTDHESNSLAAQLSDGKKTSSEQQAVLALYDPSIALLYQFDKQALLLPLGNTQIALVNRRYHCEIKKPRHLFLSSLLVDLENGTKPPFQLVNIEDYRLEMIALLSHRYTAPKTGARLNSNIIKRYRQLESKDNTEQTDNNHLLIFKKEVTQTNLASTDSQAKQSSQPPKVENIKPKRSLATYVFSLFTLTSATAGSYYFWQAQATETSPLTLLENKNQHTPKTPIKPKIAINNNQTTAIKSAREKLLAKQEIEKQHILALAKEKAKQNELKHLRELQEQKEAAALKRQQEQQTKAAALKLTLTEEVNKAYAQQQTERNAEKKRLIKEEKAHANQKRLEFLKQKELEIASAKEEKRKQETRLKAEKLAREKQEKAALLLIEKDIEEMNRQEENIRAQKIAEQRKRQEEQLRIRKLKVEQERKRHAQLAKIEAKKLAEKKRLEALVKQRRIEFEQNKKRQQREKEKVITPPVTSIEPEGRNKPQSKEQDVTKSNAAEKKRIMLAELKRQKQDQAKAKNDKLKLKQKTAVHQLVNYSKTFNRHTVQLKQKLERLKAIDQREDASSNKALIHKRKLLKGKEAVIRKRLDSLAGMYLEKLKQVCAKTKIFPVSVSASNKTERIARGVISQHMSNCSQAQSLSTSRVAATLLDKYLK
jgi:hypothetical protein